MFLKDSDFVVVVIDRASIREPASAGSSNSESADEFRLSNLACNRFVCTTYSVWSRLWIVLKFCHNNGYYQVSHLLEILRVSSTGTLLIYYERLLPPCFYSRWKTNKGRRGDEYTVNRRIVCNARGRETDGTDKQQTGIALCPTLSFLALDRTITVRKGKNPSDHLILPVQFCQKTVISVLTGLLERNLTYVAGG